jgi:beta-phosphoglucomutase-like phosphatase (HAD superfamily)
MNVDEFELDEPYAGLIFDCDGTLVDTAPVHFLAVNEALKELDLEMAADWYYARAGLTPAALWGEFEQLRGVKIDHDEMSRRYAPIFLANLDKVEEIAVVAEVARKNHGQVPMAVASNGHLRNVKATLKATGLLELFDYVVSADEVAKGKPEPDVFLEAARRMGVPVGGCIVFEDTDEGLEAALRAGMRSRDIRTVWKASR